LKYYLASSARIFCAFTLMESSRFFKDKSLDSKRIKSSSVMISSRFDTEDVLIFIVLYRISSELFNKGYKAKISVATVFFSLLVLMSENSFLKKR